jgi:hypothetical protein
MAGAAHAVPASQSEADCLANHLQPGLVPLGGVFLQPLVRAVLVGLVAVRKRGDGTGELRCQALPVIDFAVHPREHRALLRLAIFLDCGGDVARRHVSDPEPNRNRHGLGRIRQPA